MSTMELNEMEIEELENLFEERGYRFLISDGRIVWVYEEY